MPHLPFEFSGIANAQGQVNITRSIPAGPLRLRITNFTLRTQSGCRDRAHHLKVHMTDDAIFQGALHDCLSLTLGSDRSWRGGLQIDFNATGFEPGEHVHGGGDVEFVLALL